MSSFAKRAVVFLFLGGLFHDILPAQQSYVIRPQLAAPSSGDPYNLAPLVLKRPRVGLVLSGGGARGIAHVGVIRALERNNIPIDFIVGTSMGAIVGGLYAAGYSTAELESIALGTDWEDLLSLTEETRRSEMYLDQKQAQEHSFLLFRLDGLAPIIPSSLSSGQRLTNFLTTLTFQGLYHPAPDFDGLKIQFRAAATDLVSGQRVLLSHGSLAEALRATITVPLLFTPLKRGSMELVDGGLIANAPVDIARDAGCDIVISSNTTSVMRSPNQLDAPWETADQIMTIMMQASNEKQFGMSDVVIKPNLGSHLSSEFARLDTLIRLGEEAAQQHVDTIKTLLRVRSDRLALQAANIGTNHNPVQQQVLHNAVVSFEGDELPESVRVAILTRSRQKMMTVEQIREDVRQTFATGSYAEVYADVHETSRGPRVAYHGRHNPLLRELRFQGNTRLDDATIHRLFQPFVGKPINYPEARTTLENLLRRYRESSYSLARIDSLRFDQSTGILSFSLNEGVIRRVVVEGNDHTENYVIRREFPQEDGELFNIHLAQKGIVNISSTGLFKYVLLDTRYEGDQPVIVLKIEEKSTNSIRIGLHADNERSFQGLVDVRDANLFGSGSELGFTFATSFRNRLSRLEYHANRIFNTILTFNLRGYYRFDDIYVYDNSSATTETRWEHAKVGDYRQIKYGTTLAFGAQFERLGNITTELRVENQEIRAIGGSGYTPDRYKLVSLKFGTTIDTKNRFPFPTSGMMLNISYESAMQQLGSQVAFGNLFMTYEYYTTVFLNHTFRPKITIAVADATMPLAEQFSLGGLNSFFGLRDDDSRGRQLFVTNAEYRFRFPFRVVFDTFFKLRYDLGMISNLPEEIRFDKFRHGIGAELAIDTPIGPASVGIGKSFFIRRDLINKPLSWGPSLFYFSVGYGL